MTEPSKPEEEEWSWHIIPVCFAVRGGGQMTRTHCALILDGIIRSTDIEESIMIGEIWYPNDPMANPPNGEPRDKYHLEWSEGPIPHDMGEGIVLREE